MHRTFVWIGGAILLLSTGGVWWLQAQAPLDPAIAAPTITPSLVTVNTPTTITVTVSIPDPTLNPASVGLYRTNANGTKILIGEMLDSGKNGDQRPGDKVFTVQFTINEPQPQTLAFQVSGTFRGQNQVLSAVQQFAALASSTVPVVLPPDPGEPGKVTLAGIDSDLDGVRDDVFRAIVFATPESERLREALKSEAKAIQDSLTSQTQDQSRTAATKRIRAIECINYLGKGSDPRWKAILALMLNTADRIRAQEANGRRLNGAVFTAVPFNKQRSACTFNVEAMGN